MNTHTSFRGLAIGAACAVVCLAFGGVTGSKHDFSNEAWSGGDPCAACHTPHPSEPPQAAPLWNPEADLNRRFGSSSGVNPLAGTGTMMCLRCHDGTMASDMVSAIAQARSGHADHPGLFTAHARTSSHPVGVAYPQFDRGYHPIHKILARGLVPLPDGKVECSSCHDPHDFSGEPYMLVTGNQGSALCLTCHNK